MPTSSTVVTRRLMWRFAPAVLLMLATDAGAADGRIRIPESVFDDFAEALEPLRFSGFYAFKTGFIVWCGDTYSGRVLNLEFDITPGGIDARADVTVTWCGLNFGSRQPELKASGDVRYDAATRSIRIEFDSVSYTPAVDILGSTITLPVSINLTSLLNIPPIPFGETSVTFELADGRRHLNLRATNVRVTTHRGYVQITSDAVM